MAVNLTANGKCALAVFIAQRNDGETTWVEAQAMWNHAHPTRFRIKDLSEFIELAFAAYEDLMGVPFRPVQFFLGYEPEIRDRPAVKKILEAQGWKAREGGCETLAEFFVWLGEGASC